MYSDLAGKITGMLLEIDNSDLLHMLEHSESLKAKVRVASHLPFNTCFKDCRYFEICFLRRSKRR